MNAAPHREGADEMISNSSPSPPENEDQILAGRTGLVGPLVHYQDTVGSEIVVYTTRDLGLPDGAEIEPASVVQRRSVYRGTAYVTDGDLQLTQLSFRVVTESMPGDAGVHSAAISVATSFMWNVQD